MFNFPTKKVGKHVMHSRLDAQLNVTGDIAFEHGAQIDGKLDGNILGKGEDCALIIGPLAVINGSIEAHHVIVEGTVTGQVKAVALTVLPTGKIFGDIQYGSIKMEDGAQIRGAMIPLDPPASAQLPAPRKGASGSRELQAPILAGGPGS